MPPLTKANGKPEDRDISDAEDRELRGQPLDAEEGGEGWRVNGEGKWRPLSTLDPLSLGWVLKGPALPVRSRMLRDGLWFS